MGLGLGWDTRVCHTGWVRVRERGGVRFRVGHLLIALQLVIFNYKCALHILNVLH